MAGTDADNIEKWHAEMAKQSKLRLYRAFKNKYGIENYVTKNMSKSIRSFIAQIRSGTLPINIEIGRFQQKKIEDRLCPGCNEDRLCPGCNDK